MKDNFKEWKGKRRRLQREGGGGSGEEKVRKSMYYMAKSGGGRRGDLKTREVGKRKFEVEEEGGGEREGVVGEE